MIFAILISVAGFIMSLFTSVLAFLNWNFPTQIVTAFQTVGYILGLLWSFLPFIGTIIAIFLIIVPAYVIRYVFEILLWLWSLVPWIGSRTALPGVPSLDLRETHTSRNTIDLRRGRQTNIEKNTREIRQN